MSNRSHEVDAWFEAHANPQKDLVLALRTMLLDADERLAETIKWKAPTFVYQGNLASFFPKSTKHVTLMFHTGATLPDPDGIPEGDGEVARSVKIRDHEDLADKAPALRGLVAGLTISLPSGPITRNGSARVVRGSTRRVHAR